MIGANRKTSDRAREIAGRVAASLVEEGMTVGLGTGSTAAHFITHLIQRYKKGLSVQCVATSKQSQLQAEKGGLTVLNPNTIQSIDLTVDGADEVDPKKRLIKGAGGALLREKIIASASQKLIIIIDKSKQVKQLGKVPLPVEIVPFAYPSTLNHMKSKGYHPTIRMQKEGSPYYTENGNLIANIHFEQLREDPEKDHQILLSIPGVIETGFFFHLTHQVIIGYPDGHHQILS